MQPEQIDNFINHLSEFKPKVIFFFGSVLIQALQNVRVNSRFIEIMGKETLGLRRVKEKSSKVENFISPTGF